MTAKKATAKKDEIPVFLKKTFHMINTCDPDIATWSRDGLTFIVKDPEIFASDVIPQFFKHNNFSSFVRQLNFYGFRKIKSDAIRLADDHDDSLKWWRFKHENFIRGRPDLLKEIKKANQVNAADQAEVDKLKEEVSYLRGEMSKMSALVHQMAGTLKQLSGQDFSIEEPSNKKRKFEADPVGSVPIEQYSMSQPVQPYLEQSLDDAAHPEVSLLDPLVSDEDLLVEDIPVEYQPGTVTPPTGRVQRTQSADIVESMFDFVTAPDDGGVSNFQPDAVNSSNAHNLNRSVSYGDETSQPGQLDPKLSAKLNDAVSMLPKPLQECFVERVVENIASPDAYQNHVQAVKVLATAAAIEAQNQTMISNSQADAPQSDGTNNTNKLSMNNQSEMTLPVAAAALGAFLAKYGNASADNSSDPSTGNYHPVKQ